MKENGNLIFFLFIMLIAGPVGCAFDRKIPPAQPTARVGLTDAVDAALVKSQQQSQERDAKIKANIEAVERELPNFPPLPARFIAQTELKIAKERIGPVAADPVEVKATQERKVVFDSGDTEKGLEMAGKAAREAREAAAAIAKTVELIQAERAHEKQVLEENRIAHQKSLDQLKGQLEEERKSFLKWVGKALTGVAIILGLLGGFLIYSGVQSGNPVKSVVKAVCCFIGAAVFIGLAVVINQPWFVTACIIAGVVALVALIAYGVSEYQEAKEKKKLKEEMDVLDVDATRAERALKLLTVAIEKLPEETKALKEKLDRLMGPDDKALIHEIKAIAEKEGTITK